MVGDPSGAPHPTPTCNLCFCLGFGAEMRTDGYPSWGNGALALDTIRAIHHHHHHHDHEHPSDATKLRHQIHLAYSMVILSGYWVAPTQDPELHHGPRRAQCRLLLLAPRSRRFHNGYKCVMTTGCIGHSTGRPPQLRPKEGTNPGSWVITLRDRTHAWSAAINSATTPM